MFFLKYLCVLEVVFFLLVLCFFFWSGFFNEFFCKWRVLFFGGSEGIRCLWERIVNSRCFFFWWRGFWRGECFEMVFKASWMGCGFFPIPFYLFVWNVCQWPFEGVYDYVCVLWEGGKERVLKVNKYNVEYSI